MNIRIALSNFQTVLKNSSHGLFALLLGSFLLAESASGQENVVIVKKKSSEVLEDSSEANRLGKQFTLTANLVGIGANYGPAPALGVGYFLSRNDLLLAEVASGKGISSRSYTSINGTVTKTGESETKMSQVYLSYKHFTSNSFYFRLGGVYSDMTYEYNHDTISDAFLSRFQAQTFSALGVIGNQWQWENFTLGCDWIGASLVLGSNVKSQSLDGSLSDYARNSQQDDIDLYTKRSQLMALRFYLGASF